MNILFVFDEPIIPSRGGVQRVTDLLACELTFRGHSVFYLSYRFPELMASYKFSCTQLFVDIFRQSDDKNKADISRIISEYKIDCVINQLIKDDFIKYLPVGVKIISVCHVQPFCYDNITRERIWKTNAQNSRQLLFKISSLLLPKLQEWFHNHGVADEYKKVIDKSDRVCFISDKFFERVFRHIPDINKDKLCAINNPNTFFVDKANNTKENIMLYVGRVENGQKNTIDFVRSWELLYKSNKDWRAIVVGDGSDLEFNKRYAISHKIERIEFVGQQDDVAPFYKKSKIIVVTSYGESWCMAITEGMANGCIPFVYDTYESLRDIVDNEINGFIVKPTPHFMAAAIQEYIDNSSRYNKMVNSAKEKVDEFNLSNTVDKWEVLLNSR